MRRSVINAVRDDHDASAIPHLVEREQEREQVRASDGIPDEKAIELRAFNLFERLCRGPGVMDDGSDAGLMQGTTHCEAVYIVVVEHENAR